jgi:hypothetical protein
MSDCSSAGAEGALVSEHAAALERDADKSVRLARDYVIAARMFGSTIVFQKLIA